MQTLINKKYVDVVELERIELSVTKIELKL